MAGTEQSNELKKPMFQELNAPLDLNELETSEIESLCMNCHENVKLFSRGKGCLTN